MTTAARPKHGKAAKAAPALPVPAIPAIAGASRTVQRAADAARRQPKSVDARYALADTLRAAAFLGEAADCYRAVLALSPGLGSAHRDLGNVLVDSGKIEEGLAELRRAVELMPTDAGALLGIIRTHEKRGTPTDALPYVEQLGREAAAHPRSARHQLHHALALSQVGQLDAAIDGVRAALALNDADAEGWDFLGLLLADRRDWAGARAAYDRALALQPDRGQTLFNRATLRLRLGDYAGGFADYEGRWDSPHFTTPRRDYAMPQWTGEPLDGRVLLLHTEQGLGDTIQFARFIANARAAGAGRVIVECEDHMARLLATVQGVDAVVRRGEPLPEADVQAAIMSLGHLTGATLDTVATAAAPYLGVDRIRRQLALRAPATRLRVGIVWEASRSGESFQTKSIPLDAFAPLANRHDIELVSLQKGPGEQGLIASPMRSRITDIGSRLVDLRDTADVVAQLDLVISVDTAVCHLAGAMGVPTWTLLAESCDWRWGLERADCPWYPTMRLFRQPTAGNWGGVMAQVVAALDGVAPFALAPDGRFAPRAATPADVHLLVALKHTAQGEFLESAEAYNDAVMVDATNADVWNNFGVVLAKAGHVADSRIAFGNAVAIAPSHADAARNLRSVEQALQGAPRAAAQGDAARPRLGMDWQVSAHSGWGIYGLNFVAHSLRRGDVLPVVFHEPDLSSATPMQRVALAGLSSTRDDAARALHTGECPFPTLHALGNGLAAGPLASTLRGSRRVGVVFFEDTRLDAEAIARGRSFDRIIAGSTWNAELLKAAGVEQTALVIQGIDTTVFHPAPRAGWLAGRFTVFSGGKLEYRKGQDLVVAAFARFRQRHPEALLMVAWHNHWPQTMAEITIAGHVQDAPALRNGALDVTSWLAKHGIPAESVLDLGLVPNAMMGPMVREADVALFPNRAEGGTNLVAMEALASGVPCILSANTGHLDLTDGDCNIVLAHQSVCRATPSFAGTDGWGESSVDEIVEALEFAYRHREEAQRRAANAAAVMANASWQHQIDRLYASIGDLLA